MSSGGTRILTTYLALTHGHRAGAAAERPRRAGAVAPLRYRRPVRPADDDPARRHAHAHSIAGACRTTADGQCAGGAGLHGGRCHWADGGGRLDRGLGRTTSRAVERGELSVLRMDAGTPATPATGGRAEPPRAARRGSAAPHWQCLPGLDDADVPDLQYRAGA